MSTGSAQYGGSTQDGSSGPRRLQSAQNLVDVIEFSFGGLKLARIKQIFSFISLLFRLFSLFPISFFLGFFLFF